MINLIISIDIRTHRYIYDPRYTNIPVLKEDYFRVLREINSDYFDVFESME